MYKVYLQSIILYYITIKVYRLYIHIVQTESSNHHKTLFNRNKNNKVYNDIYFKKFKVVKKQHFF